MRKSQREEVVELAIDRGLAGLELCEAQTEDLLHGDEAHMRDTDKLLARV